MNKEDLNTVKRLLKQCIEDERSRVLVLYDQTTKSVLPLFEHSLEELKKIYEIIEIKTARCHGEEPSDETLKKMLNSDAIICLTKYSMAHTEARKKTDRNGIVFLSMPEYSSGILSNKAFEVEYKDRLKVVHRYADILTKGNKVRIISSSGTNLTINISERIGNCCPGMTNNEMRLGSPPDIEANVAPVESETEGILVIDGSITDYRIGLLKTSVILKIQKGMIIDIQSESNEVVKTLDSIFENTHTLKAKIVGELGIGFNDHASLCGNMLIDEGTQGCIHFGMGSNWTIGGKNKVNFHLDFVMKDATVYVDEEIIIDKGRIVYE